MALRIPGPGHFLWPTAPETGDGKKTRNQVSAPICQYPQESWAGELWRLDQSGSTGLPMNGVTGPGRHRCVCVTMVLAYHTPDSRIGLVWSCPYPTPYLSCSSPGPLRV